MQKLRSRLAVIKDVQIKLSMEAFVSDTVQKLRDVVMKDVPTLLFREEYVSGMVQLKRGRLVVMEDVPIMLSKEEFAKDMVLKLRDEGLKDVLGVY